MEPEDNDNGVDAGILFARAMIMTATVYYVLTMFNETCWLINTLVFSACTAFALHKAGKALTGTATAE